MPIPSQQFPNDGPAEGNRPPRQRVSSASLLTPAEAAAVLHVDANTLARWSKAGKLGAVRTPGGHRRYLASEVARLIRQPARQPARGEGPRSDRSRTA